MPFGAEVLPSGGVRFRLWAPGAHKVELEIAGRFMPLHASRDGWFEHLVATAGPGTLYRYRIDGELSVPDPASRFQPRDVDGPSEVIDQRGYRWSDHAWTGRPWNEAVICELHVGTFTPEGTYAGVVKKLKQLVDVGITAIELMPLSDFAGKRNWGYDGVLPFAPDSAYGRPEQLKALVDAAHAAGLMVLLDVVYNHFGPKGNYLPRYAPQFFTERHKTPWGAAIDFGNEVVRQYFRHNVLYWLEEYRFDGLRFDAVHAIVDDSPRHILDEICASVSAGKHLILENDANQARFIGPGRYTAQWNDDSHHAYHVLATGERDGYYIAYADSPARHLARCLAEGFAYQGDVSPFSNEARGEPSAHLPASCFVDFLQNHDQIGNRALGERIASVERRTSPESAHGDPAPRARRRRCSSWAKSGAAGSRSSSSAISTASSARPCARGGARSSAALLPSRIPFRIRWPKAHSGNACSTGPSATRPGLRTTRSSCSCAPKPLRRASSGRASTACSARALSK